MRTGYRIRRTGASSTRGTARMPTTATSS